MTSCPFLCFHKIGFGITSLQILRSCAIGLASLVLASSMHGRESELFGSQAGKPVATRQSKQTKVMIRHHDILLKRAMDPPICGLPFPDSGQACSLIMPHLHDSYSPWRAKCPQPSGEECSLGLSFCSGIPMSGSQDKRGSRLSSLPAKDVRCREGWNRQGACVC